MPAFPTNTDPREITFWTCPKGHVVLDMYMPQSGTRCNVQGCAGQREQHTIRCDRTIVAANDLLKLMFNMEAGYSEPAIRLERRVSEHCHMLAVRDRLVPDPLKATQP